MVHVAPCQRFAAERKQPGGSKAAQKQQQNRKRCHPDCPVSLFSQWLISFASTAQIFTPRRKPAPLFCNCYILPFLLANSKKNRCSKKEAEETPVFPLLHCFLTKQNFMIYFFTLFNNSSPIREVCLGQHSRRVGNLISIDGKSALLYQPASLTLAGNQFDFYE